MSLASIRPPTHYKHTYTAPHHGFTAVKTFDIILFHTSLLLKVLLWPSKWLLVSGTQVYTAACPNARRQREICEFTVRSGLSDVQSIHSKQIINQTSDYMSLLSPSRRTTGRQRCNKSVIGSRWFAGMIVIHNCPNVCKLLYQIIECNRKSQKTQTVVYLLPLDSLVWQKSSSRSLLIHFVLKVQDLSTKMQFNNHNYVFRGV